MAPILLCLLYFYERGRIRTNLRAAVSYFLTRKRDDASLPHEEGNRGSARWLIRTGSGVLL